MITTVDNDYDNLCIMKVYDQKKNPQKYLNAFCGNFSIFLSICENNWALILLAVKLELTINFYSYFWLVFLSQICCLSGKTIPSFLRSNSSDIFLKRRIE